MLRLVYVLNLFLRISKISIYGNIFGLIVISILVLLIKCNRYIKRILVLGYLKKNKIFNIF